MAEEEEEELLDYEEEDVAPAEAAKAASNKASKASDAAGKKKGYVGMHSTGFRDFLLKPELLRAIVDCGFEHPSEGERIFEIGGGILLRLFFVKMSPPRLAAFPDERRRRW